MPLNRNQKILAHVKQNGYGLEIGPSHRPVAPKKRGYRVDIIDHACREDLINKYRSHGVNVSNIEEVDFIWKGQSYSELTGKRKFYDWIIASHVVEHTPDLIGFLNECDSVLNDEGVISLAVPDKRYCFDHFRPLTGLARVIDNHLHKNAIHSPGEAAEYYLNVVAKNKRIAWNSESEGDYSLIHSAKEARSKMDTIISENKYIDLHTWCFTPSSFRLIIHDLHTLGLIPFKEVSFLPTTGCEFFVTLGRQGKGLQARRIHMLKAIEAEICTAGESSTTTAPSSLAKQIA